MEIRISVYIYDSTPYFTTPLKIMAIGALASDSTALGPLSWFCIA